MLYPKNSWRKVNLCTSCYCRTVSCIHKNPDCDKAEEKPQQHVAKQRLQRACPLVGSWLHPLSCGLMQYLLVQIAKRLDSMSRLGPGQCGPGRFILPDAKDSHGQALSPFPGGREHLQVTGLCSPLGTLRRSWAT